MASSGGGQPPRRPGPSQDPLKINEDSRKIKKPPLGRPPQPPPQPPRPPITTVRYELEPRVIHCLPKDFAAIVQKLTGQQISSSAAPSSSSLSSSSSWPDSFSLPSSSNASPNNPMPVTISSAGSSSSPYSCSLPSSSNASPNPSRLTISPPGSLSSPGSYSLASSSNAYPNPGRVNISPDLPPPFSSVMPHLPADPFPHGFPQSSTPSFAPYSERPYSTPHGISLTHSSMQQSSVRSVFQDPSLIMSPPIWNDDYIRQLSNPNPLEGSFSQDYFSPIHFDHFHGNVTNNFEGNNLNPMPNANLVSPYHPIAHLIPSPSSSNFVLNPNFVSPDYPISHTNLSPSSSNDVLNLISLDSPDHHIPNTAPCPSSSNFVLYPHLVSPDHPISNTIPCPSSSNDVLNPISLDSPDHHIPNTAPCPSSSNFVLYPHLVSPDHPISNTIPCPSSSNFVSPDRDNLAGEANATNRTSNDWDLVSPDGQGSARLSDSDSYANLEDRLNEFLKDVNYHWDL